MASTQALRSLGRSKEYLPLEGIDNFCSQTWLLARCPCTLRRRNVGSSAWTRLLAGATVKETNDVLFGRTVPCIEYWIKGPYSLSYQGYCNVIIVSSHCVSVLIGDRGHCLPYSRGLSAVIVATPFSN
jgi:hypothetical protein